MKTEFQANLFVTFCFCFFYPNVFEPTKVVLLFSCNRDKNVYWPGEVSRKSLCTKYVCCEIAFARNHHELYWVHKLASCLLLSELRERNAKLRLTSLTLFCKRKVNPTISNAKSLFSSLLPRGYYRHAKSFRQLGCSWPNALDVPFRFDGVAIKPAPINERRVDRAIPSARSM